MKKFLSLALALIMTLSLVTISAGATEYKDLTDKDEIKYEEAVAVLNRLGIITGYSEGDFRPEGELTRGAAAKIIVSLLIGPEAAEALPTTASPYPDVPAGNVFAGYISFCKNSGIISGYNDGTFRPTGTLTGFAFSKMLLGALGYDSDIEKFTGSGWTVRVASIGGAAGLFDRISFKGGETVNRETACQLALNTLKATLVEYTGGSNITVTGPQDTNVTVSTDKTCKYVTSNQDFATNIKGNDNAYRNDTGNGTGNDRNWADWYTVEFGEEHFVDLKLEHSKYNPTEDKFGRPSVEWSYKRVTIGTYPLEADYVYNTQVTHNVPETTAAAKVRALGLGDYKVTDNTEFYLNGRSMDNADLAGALKDANGKNSVACIADWTDNGALVEVYISYKNADEISHVVVSQSQLMEVKRIGSNAVSLQMYDDNAKPDDNLNRGDDTSNEGLSGYNKNAIFAKIEDVETNDDYFTMLSGMKSGDLVVVVPVAKDNTQKTTDEYEVGEAYVPESVSGAFTNVTTHGATGDNDERRAIAVTVGGTKYNISQWHNGALGDANSDTLKITRGDVTLYMDKYGNAMLGKNFGDASGWLIVGAFRQTLTDGRLTTLVSGWDESGNKLELNLGPNNSYIGGNRYVNKEGATIIPGDLVRYSSTTNSSITDWAIYKDVTRGVYNVYTEMSNVAGEEYSIKASNPNIRLYGYNDGKDQTSETGKAFGVAKMSGTVKFVFVNFDEDGEVSSVNVQKQTNVSNAELVKVNPHIGGGSAAQAGMKDDDTKVVVIKNDYTDVNSLYLGYISKYIGQATLSSSMSNTKNDALTASNLKNDTRVIHEYTAIMRNTDGRDGEEVTVYSYDRLNPGDFFYWTKRDVEGIDNFYDLRRPNELTGRNTTVMWATLNSLYNDDKNVLRVQDYIYSLAANDGNTIKMYPAVATQNMSDLDHGEFANTLNVSGAVWHDLTNNRINNATDLKSFLKANDGSDGKPALTVKLRMVVNDNPESDGFRDVYLIVIESTPTKVSVGADKPASSIPIYVTNTQKYDKPPEIDDTGLTKFDLTITGKEFIQSVTVNGKEVNVDDLKSAYPAGTTIAVTPVDGYLVNGKSGTVSFTFSDAPISITVAEQGTATEGESVALTGLDKMAKSAKVTAVVYDDAIVPTLTFTAPDWAVKSGPEFADTDMDTFAYSVQIGNKAPTPIDFTMNSNNTNVEGGTFTVTLKQIDLPEGTTIEDVKINATIKQWKTVKVEYTVDGQPVAVNTDATGTAATATLTTTNTSAFKAKLPSNFSGTNVAWEITGATRANSASLKGTAATITGGTGFGLVNTSNPVTALGTGPVVVKFGAMTEAPITNWVISADSTSTGVMDAATAITNGTFIATAPVGADATFLVKVVVDGTAAAAGETVNVSKTAAKLNLDLTVGERSAFALGTIGGDPVSAYNVHIALLNGETEVYSRDVKVDGKGDNVDRSAGLDMSKVSSDLTLKLTVTPVLSNKIDGGVVNKDTGVVSIQFKEPVLANQVTISKFAAVSASISKVEIIPYTARETADTAYAIGAYVTLSNIDESVRTVSIKIVGDIECKDGSILDKTTAFNVTVNNGNITGTGEAGAPVTPADPDAPAGPGGAASQSVNAVPSVVGSVSGITIKSYKSGDSSKTQITTADKFAEGDKIVVEVVVAGTVKNDGSNGDSAFTNAATLTFDSGWSVTTAAATGFTVADGVVTFTEKSAAAALVSNETTFTAEYTVTKADAEAQAAFDLPAITFAAANSN